MLSFRLGHKTVRCFECVKCITVKTIPSRSRSLPKTSRQISPKTVNSRSAARHAITAAARIVATSEFWWEEEPEYDAVKDILSPKDVVIAVVSPHDDGQHVDNIRTVLTGYTFQTCFTSEQMKSIAEAIWEGRSKPPYFYKLRTQASLNQLEEAPSDGTADELWKQLCTQNWRVELDHGLNKGTDSQVSEAVLVVATQEAAQQLLAALPSESPSPSRLMLISFGGWDKEEALESWKRLEVVKTQAL